MKQVIEVTLIKCLLSIIIFNPFYLPGQSLDGNAGDSLKKTSCKLYFFRPYKFESSLVRFHAIVKDVATNAMQTYEIKNKGKVEVNVTSIKEMELTVLENNRHYLQGVIIRPGDVFYFKVALRRHLPTLSMVSLELGKKEYESIG